MNAYSIYIQQVSLGIPEEMQTIDNFEIQCVIYVVCITSSKGWTMHGWLCHVDGGSITRFGSYMLSGRSNKNQEPHDQAYDGIELPWWQHDISHDTSPHYSVDLTCTITRRLYVWIIIHESSTIHREHGRIMLVYNICTSNALVQFIPFSYCPRYIWPQS